MTDAAPSRSGWSALPRWVRLGLVVLVAVVVALVAIVAFRVFTRVAPIPLGVTGVEDLRAGSCVAESSLELAEYTVVPCAEPHPMQVFAVAEIGVDNELYAVTGDVLRAFADEVCGRYLEYRLYLDPEFDKLRYEAFSIGAPTAADAEAGDTDALCILRLESGEPMTGDLYRAMP